MGISEGMVIFHTAPGLLFEHFPDDVHSAEIDTGDGIPCFVVVATGKGIHRLAAAMDPTGLLDEVNKSSSADATTYNRLLWASAVTRAQFCPDEKTMIFTVADNYVMILARGSEWAKKLGDWWGGLAPSEAEERATLEDEASWN